MTTNLPARSTGTQRRRELGAFLRNRRERLTCADVGLPVAGRRRTPGLRREELAMLTGISTTWLTYLEQGRDVRASRQVLDALARTLRLSATERAHVFDLAAEALTPAVVPVLAQTVSAITQALDPNPAYVTAGDFEVLAWNAAAARLFPSLVAWWDGERPNVARWLFRDPDAREVLPEWELVAQDVLARLRAAVAPPTTLGTTSWSRNCRRRVWTRSRGGPGTMCEPARSGGSGCATRSGVCSTWPTPPSRWPTTRSRPSWSTSTKAQPREGGPASGARLTVCRGSRSLAGRPLLDWAPRGLYSDRRGRRYST